MADKKTEKKKGIISKLLGKKDKEPVVEEKECGCCCGCSEEKSGENKGCCG